MPKAKGTIGQLLKSYYEMEQFTEQWPTISMFIGGRMEKFMKLNGEKINDAQLRRADIYAKYVEMEGEGDAKQIKLTPDQKMIFKKGLIELSKAEQIAHDNAQRELMNKELADLMAEPIDFIFYD